MKDHIRCAICRGRSFRVDSGKPDSTTEEFSKTLAIRCCDCGARSHNKELERLFFDSEGVINR